MYVFLVLVTCSLIAPNLSWGQGETLAPAEVAAAFPSSEGVFAPVTTLRKLVDLIIESTVKYSFQVLGGLIILLAGWIIARFLSRFVENFLLKHKIDITIKKFLVGFVKLVVMALAGLLALGKFGIEIAPFIAGLGVVGFGTSLALQGPLSNYAAGISLIFTKPFKVGDIIEVVGQMGEVEDMTLPRTILKTVDNTRIVIPNKHIIGEIIHNFSELKRLDIKVSVAYDSQVERAIDLLKLVVAQEDRISKAAEVKIGIFDFGDSAVNLYARAWCRQEDYWDVLFSANKKILEVYKQSGIEIPYPHQEVTIRQVKP